MEERCDERLMRDHEIMKIIQDFFSEGQSSEKGVYTLNYNFLKDDDESDFEEFKVSIQEIMENFIIQAQLIFKHNVLFLLKMVRIILDAKKPL